MRHLFLTKYRHCCKECCETTHCICLAVCLVCSLCGLLAAIGLHEISIFLLSLVFLAEASFFITKVAYHFYATIGLDSGQFHGHNMNHFFKLACLIVADEADRQTIKFRLIRYSFFCLSLLLVGLTCDQQYISNIAFFFLSTRLVMVATSFAIGDFAKRRIVELLASQNNDVRDFWREEEWI